MRCSTHHALAGGCARAHRLAALHWRALARRGSSPTGGAARRRELSLRSSLGTRQVRADRAGQRCGPPVRRRLPAHGRPDPPRGDERPRRARAPGLPHARGLSDPGRRLLRPHDQAQRDRVPARQSPDPERSRHLAGLADAARAVGMPATSRRDGARRDKATISNGLAIAPANAPPAVKEVIAAANKIAFKPYIFGGGHGSFNRRGIRLLGLGQLRAARRRAAVLAARTRASSSPTAAPAAAAGSRSGPTPATRTCTSPGCASTPAPRARPGGSRWTTEGRSNAGFVDRHPSGL